jgi:hypothetical protein
MRVYFLRSWLFALSIVSFKSILGDIRKNSSNREYSARGIVVFKLMAFCTNSTG